MLTYGVQILVVDDDPYIQRALSFVLRKEGFTVETASDGQEALRKVRELKPALLFLDVMMPKTHGFDVCRTVKSDKQLNGCYIIMLTAKGQDVDKEKGIREGADEYMTKPFSPKEVLARVREILNPL
jgi:DNA-binding response OmpR family regulator